MCNSPVVMFNESQNNHFKNTSFTIKNTTNFNADTGVCDRWHHVLYEIFDIIFVVSCINQGQALGVLYNRVSPNAIMNAGGRADEVGCHPGTREKLIGPIDNWRLNIQNNVTANRLFWLSGPAGAGKTAIVQTVAENWKSLGIPAANYFFFRTDPSRSDIKSFMSTLLYQIFAICPAAREVVAKVLSMKPRILEAGLEEQVKELICNTFRSIQPPLPHNIVPLIDGLDECNSKISQKHIINIFDKLVGQGDLPFIVLIASRAEPHISAAFAQLASQA